MTRSGTGDVRERSALQAALGDDYELVGMLGRGGFGAVYAARQRALDRPVAIKIIRPALDDAASVSAFAGEARLLASLDHPHIVTAHDFFERDGRWFLVMERMAGGALNATAVGSRTVEAACAIALAVADALHHAHAGGVLHRDVKPTNILFAVNGLPKVADLGIAKAVTGADTQVSQVIGTPDYMSPEQFDDSGRISAATDVYSLATVLYELLEGRRPFRGAGAWMIAAVKQRDDPAPMTKAPAPLVAILTRALSRSPTARPASAKQFALELASAAADALGHGWLGRSGIPVRIDDEIREAATSRARRDVPPTRPLDDPFAHDESTGCHQALPPWTDRPQPPRPRVPPHLSGWRVGSRAIGIDLGTTNSVVSVLEGGEPAVIANAQGSRTTPSVVAFTKQGEVLVGEVAKRQAVRNVERTVPSVLRHLGTGWRIPIDGEEYLPQQILAFLLAGLVRDAETYLGQSVGEAVISVPAFFSYGQRRAVAEAAAIAGLHVLRTVSGSTLAALDYALHKGEQEQEILIFDLGGGTCDVSLLAIGEGVVEVKSTTGDTHLGGDDWDQRIVEHLLKTFSRRHGVDLSGDKTAMRRLREASEKAKIELSWSAQTTINLPYITASAEGPLHLDVSLSQAEFQRMTRDLIDRCEGLFHQAVKDAFIKVSDIDHVVLVGGSTRMPAVVDLVRELAGGKEPNKGLNPDEAVAIGASLQVGIVKGEVKDVLLLNMTSPSLGIETKGGIMAKLIERNTTIPIKCSEIFTTAEDNQPSVQIQVLNGEREIASRNEMLGMFELTGLPPVPRGVPQIEVTFDIDANNIVHVSAKDLATGKEQPMTITSGSALPDEQLNRMAAIVQRIDEQDRKRREEAEIRNQAENLVYFTERFLAENGDKIDSAIKVDVEEKLSTLHVAGGGTDIAAIRAAIEELLTMGQAMYAQARAGQTTDGPGGAGGDVSDDENDRSLWLEIMES